MRQPRDVITQMCTAETREMRRFRRVGNCHSFVGEKAIWKSKSLKAGMIGALFEVPVAKVCTALYRESDFEIKTVKAPGSPTTF